MELVLYATSESENVINKTMIEKERLEFTAKNDLNIVTPVLRLRFTDINLLFSSNYAEIPEFGRFYFVRGIQNISKDVWALTLECDVLESFKSEFMLNTVQVSRQLREGDFFNVSLETETVKEIDLYNSDVVLSRDKNIILSTIGVG